eukprot:6131564-Pleurochrysis_carterae.AAC.1
MTWLAREAEVPTAQRTPGRPSQTPFFTDDSGSSAWTSTTSRRVAKKMAAACGEDPAHFGG